ncbi:MAG: hypothetical protein NUV63_10045, partial [Gallionella sp.]|nr:hypothetical protein [Gallionella sp.]
GAPTSPSATNGKAHKNADADVGAPGAVPKGRLDDLSDLWILPHQFESHPHRHAHYLYSGTLLEQVRKDHSGSKADLPCTTVFQFQRAIPIDKSMGTCSLIN